MKQKSKSYYTLFALTLFIITFTAWALLSFIRKERNIAANFAESTEAKYAAVYDALQSATRRSDRALIRTSALELRLAEKTIAVFKLRDSALILSDTPIIKGVKSFEAILDKETKNLIHIKLSLSDPDPGHPPFATSFALRGLPL
ncbi:MAG: hypothetical protein GX221_00630 [Candidatus Riflebacteria bacterium]|nr:hypothetical protein [Candidatus Riflebacteria bacterium]